MCESCRRERGGRGRREMKSYKRAEMEDEGLKVRVQLLVSEAITRTCPAFIHSPVRNRKMKIKWNKLQKQKNLAFENTGGQVVGGEEEDEGCRNIRSRSFRRRE